MLAIPRPVRTLLPLIAGFVLLALTVLSAIWLSARQETAVGWVRHTLEVENRLNHILLLTVDAETGQRGYLLSGHPAYLGPYQIATSRLPGELDALDRATADNPDKHQEVAKLRSAIRAKLDELATTVALTRMDKSADAIALMRSGHGRALMIEVRALVAAMIANEDRLLATRTENAARVTMLARILLVACALLVALIAIVAVRDGHRRESALEHTNQRLREEMAERSAAQTQVHQLQKMEAVGQLTGGIAHDFNNMLAVVIGSLDMAQRKLTGSDNPNVGRFITNAQRGAERAATLTARLLAFSRQQPLEPRVLDANKLVGGMREMLARTLGEAIQIETVLAGDLWAVHADPVQIESALVNLAVNARDAMPDGGQLLLETANTELDERYARVHEEVQPGHYVMLSISDTGTGMSADVVERAFEPFFTTKRAGRGTGLGLSQVFGFVKQSRGHLKIYSEIGRGTRVKIYLPRHVDAMHEMASEAPHQNGQPSIPPGKPGEVILVVEDEPRVRLMSVEALRDLGYTVVHAANARQALDLFVSHPRVDLLFTDVVMPDMTGRELADLLLARQRTLKVLYTTGYTRNAIIHSGMVDRDVVFLAKPFSIDALALKVRQVLDGGA